MKLSNAIREGGWVVAGQVTSILGSLVLVRTLTEFLSSVQYGELSLGLTVVSLVNQVVMAGVLATIGRHYAMAHQENEFAAYKAAAWKLMMRATLVVLLIGGCIWWLLILDGRLVNFTTLALGALAFAILSTYNAALNGMQNAARRRGSVAAHAALDAWLRIGFALICMHAVEASNAMVLAGYVAAACTVLVSQLYVFKRTHPGIAKKPDVATVDGWYRRLTQFSLPFAAWGGFTWAQQVSDKWALGFFASVEDVGRYAVLYQLGYSPAVILGGIVILYMGPILFQRSGDASDAERNRSVHELGWQIGLASFAATLLASGLAYLFHDLIFKTFVAASFQNASRHLPWVVAAGGFFASGQMFALKLYSELKAGKMILANTASASIGVALNLLGAWLYGLEGVIAALVAYSLLYFVWMAVLASRPLLDVPVVGHRVG